MFNWDNEDFVYNDHFHSWTIMDSLMIFIKEGHSNWIDWKMLELSGIQDYKHLLEKLTILNGTEVFYHKVQIQLLNTCLFRGKP